VARSGMLVPMDFGSTSGSCILGSQIMDSIEL
jgi:hypothetical protein